jgi:hypothetical protein
LASPFPSLPDPSAIDVVSSAQATARLLWAWESQLEQQFRLYGLLEHALKKPFLLSLHYCVVQLAFQTQLQLVNHYYDFDRSFIRCLMGLKLSTKTRGQIASMQDKLQEQRTARRASGVDKQEAQQAAAMASRRNSQSVISQTGLGSSGGVGLSALSGAASEGDLASSLSALALSDDAGDLGVLGGGGSVRYSSCCRQFDNLRRIYRSRWGEKGDGVVGEVADQHGSMEEPDNVSSLFSSSPSPAGGFTPLSAGGGASPSSISTAGLSWRKREEILLSERWRAMRAAAVAAMAKRGFGGADKSSAATPAASAATAAAHLKAQQWMLRHFDAAGPGAGGGLSSHGGGGLDSFFGLDSSSQAICLPEQAAPVFYQAQFRLHAALARSYSRLVFLAHYRIGVSLTLKRKKRHVELLSFDEVHLVAQIIQRCWAIPVGGPAEAAAAGEEEPHIVGQSNIGPPPDTARSMVTSPLSLSLVSTATHNNNPALSAGAAHSSSFFPQTNVSPRALKTGGVAGATATEGAAAASTGNNLMFTPHAVTRLLSADSVARRFSVDESSVAPAVFELASATPNLDAPSVSATVHSVAASRSTTGAAACGGYDFLPIVAQMRESDEDRWVGDVLDMEFVSGLAELKAVMNSKMLDEYGSVLAKLMRETIQLHQSFAVAPNATGAVAGGQQGVVPPTPHSQAGAIPSTSQQPQLQRQPSALPSAMGLLPRSSTFSRQGSTVEGVTAGPPPQSSPTSGLSLAGVLRPAVLQKLLPRIPALLKSLHALAVQLHKGKRVRTLLADLLEEVLRPLLKLGAAPAEMLVLLRQVRDAVSSVPSLAHLAIEPKPVYPFPYERAAHSAAAATTHTSGGAAAAGAAGRPTSTPSISLSARPPAVTPSASMGAASSSSSMHDPLRRAMVHWCRFLDAVVPLCFILYTNLVQAQEGA